jgi:hypothetical protein
MKDAKLNSSAIAMEPLVKLLHVNGAAFKGAVPPSPPLIKIAASRMSTIKNSRLTKIERTLTERSTWR